MWWTAAAAFMASVVSMSCPAFACQFKDLTGHSPLAYLSSLRIDVAAQLLRGTDGLVSDIAKVVGCTSEFAFARDRGLPLGRYRWTTTS